MLNYSQEEKEDAPFKAELDSIQARYAAGGSLAASARDFNERVNTLVLKGTREKRDQWINEARTEYAAGQPKTGPPPVPVEIRQAAQKPPADTTYLKEMPEVARVIGDARGSDSSDTAARQWGTLYQLRDIIAVMSDGRVYRGQLTPDEAQMQATYFTAMQRLEQPKFDEEETRRLGMNSPRAKWFGLRTHYELDKSVRTELLQRYFSAEWQGRYLALYNAQETLRVQREQQKHQEQQQAVAAAQRAAQNPSVPAVNLPALDKGLDAPSWLWMTAVGAVILLIIVRKRIRWVILTYNTLVLLRNKTQNAWAQIDVQLKRRHDLILNFVEAVKGYTKHERGTLDEVAQARAMAAGATTVVDRAAAENALTASMKTLYAVVEAYPDLKANQNFLALEHNLTATEDLLASSRQTYNNVVLDYNTRVQSFPTNLLAWVFRFTVRDYFEVSAAGERETPIAAF